MKRFLPRVTRNFLILLAGYVWVSVGLMLVYRALFWLMAPSIDSALPYLLPGLAAGLVAHHFGFLKIVDKNLERILEMEDKQPVILFIPGRSYLLMVFMMGFGFLLRHTMLLPERYLAVLYSAVGSALVLSGVRYLRVSLLRALPGNREEIQP